MLGPLRYGLIVHAWVAIAWFVLHIKPENPYTHAFINHMVFLSMALQASWPRAIGKTFGLWQKAKVVAKVWAKMTEVLAIPEDVDNNHHVAGKDMCVGFLFQGF
jgi:hypothetical protein